MNSFVVNCSIHCRRHKYEISVVQVQCAWTIDKYIRTWRKKKHGKNEHGCCTSYVVCKPIWIQIVRGAKIQLALLILCFGRCNDGRGGCCCCSRRRRRSCHLMVSNSISCCLSACLAPPYAICIVSPFCHNYFRPFSFKHSIFVFRITRAPVQCVGYGCRLFLIYLTWFSLCTLHV